MQSTPSSALSPKSSPKVSELFSSRGWALSRALAGLVVFTRLPPSSFPLSLIRVAFGGLQANPDGFHVGLRGGNALVALFLEGVKHIDHLRELDCVHTAVGAVVVVVALDVYHLPARKTLHRLRVVGLPSPFGDLDARQKLVLDVLGHPPEVFLRGPHPPRRLLRLYCLRTWRVLSAHATLYHNLYVYYYNRFLLFATVQAATRHSRQVAPPQFVAADGIIQLGIPEKSSSATAEPITPPADACMSIASARAIRTSCMREFLSLIWNLRCPSVQPPDQTVRYNLRMDQDFPNFMVRVQQEFARHSEEYTALDVVGFPYSEFHERGRSPEETGLTAYEYFASDEYSDYGAYEDQVLFKVEA